ncbi:MAG: SDR family NAD(P)-dependent oxidoreductase [Thermoanaerobaculia bacterium]
MTTEIPGRRKALITGASSGIGADLARIFAREGHDLVLVARSRDRLDALAREVKEKYGATARVLPIDLSEPGAARVIHAQAAEEGIEVDVLVNNAGFGMRGPFPELDPGRQLEMIQVNLVALTELTHLFAPEMVRRARGRILNVASTAAFQPGPLMAVYCATKAYVLSFSAALADELRGSGVTVTCVAPGATETGFGEVAGVSATRLFRSGTMSSRDVAEAAYAALSKGLPLVVPGFKNCLLSASVRFVSIPTAARVARLLLEEA